ncbi:MAG: hypothetical protein IPL59_16670 [Candidatus Competibacteraceae bacterium]|nr:hypothetical protein [Candidatus Competibacteraceae bacterium]
MVKQLREAFPNWPICVVEDSLFANGPHIKLLKELKVGYIISVKPDGQESMFDEVKNRVFKNECEEFEVLGEDQVLRGYRWINDIPLNKSHPDLLVNFLDYWEIREGKEFNFSWVTDIKLNTNNVHPVMKGGRSRWHIENQTFNTLKNQDYEFEHNFGHGQQYLATVFAMLMMLAFLIDQVQEYGCAFSKLLGSVFIRAPRCGSKSKDFLPNSLSKVGRHCGVQLFMDMAAAPLQPNTS